MECCICRIRSAEEEDERNWDESVKACQGNTEVVDNMLGRYYIQHLVHSWALGHPQRVAMAKDIILVIQ